MLQSKDLVAESGVLLPFESSITGRSVVMRVAAPTTMQASAGTARLALEVDNAGQKPLRQCRASVDGYTSRNGYLHGDSPTFDLGPGARAALNVSLSATHPPPGDHPFRVKIECANERLAVADTVLTVR